jgi:radical SAM superfamily enzyme YgiQ (UPF0313 family)
MLARVFPRKTHATPIDDYSFVGDPGLFLPEDITEVHISVAFTWDLREAERLAGSWSRIAPVKIGGPATGMRGEDFVSGRYLKPGYVITSRGCPNFCWFCSVPAREGNAVRELPVREGWNILDDNLLSCSEPHIRAVFAMLKRQKMGKPQFTGGLEAKRLKSWHVEFLKELRPREVFFAYDTADDLLPLKEAVRLLKEADYFPRDVFRCYVLIGFPGDSFQEAELRLQSVWNLGMYPMAMLYRDKGGKTFPAWRRFQRLWARPALVYVRQRQKQQSAAFDIKNWDKQFYPEQREV